MARYKLTASVTVPGSGYSSPPRVLAKGQVVELSATEVAAITGAGGAVTATTQHDALGEGAGASNS
jgi:hypothetical protein